MGSRYPFNFLRRPKDTANLDQPGIAPTAGITNEPIRSYKSSASSHNFQNSESGPAYISRQPLLSQQQSARCVHVPAHNHGAQDQAIAGTAQTYPLHRARFHQIQSTVLTSANNPSEHNNAVSKPVLLHNFDKSNGPSVLGADAFFFHHDEFDPLWDNGLLPPTSGWENSLPNASCLSRNTAGHSPARMRQLAMGRADAHRMLDEYGNLSPTSTPVVASSPSTAFHPSMISSWCLHDNPQSMESSHTVSTAETLARSLDDPNNLIFDFARQSPHTRVGACQEPIAVEDSTLPLQSPVRREGADYSGYSSIPSIDRSGPGRYQNQVYPATSPSQNRNRNAGSARMTGHAKGRKNALSSEQASHAAAVRGVGACSACRKKKIKVGD